MRIWKYLFLPIALFGVLSYTKPVLAHAGGVLYLANEPSGDFEISAWVLPQLVTTAEPVHMDILILAPSVDGQVSQDFILGADIKVEATYMGDDMTIVNELEATVDTQNELFYLAIIPLLEDGEWQIDINASRGEQSGRASFVLLVERETQINWFMIGGALIVVLGAAVMILRSRPSEDLS